MILKFLYTYFLAQHIFRPASPTRARLLRRRPTQFFEWHDICYYKYPLYNVRSKINRKIKQFFFWIMNLSYVSRVISTRLIIGRIFLLLIGFIRFGNISVETTRRVFFLFIIRYKPFVGLVSKIYFQKANEKLD